VPLSLTILSTPTVTYVQYTTRQMRPPDVEKTSDAVLPPPLTRVRIQSGLPVISAIAAAGGPAYRSLTKRISAWSFLEALLAMLKPSKLVAIGRDAGAALADVDVPVSTVRHPSYGGQADFIAGIEAIYRLPASNAKPITTTLPFPEFA
jgi:hypothetical protein